MPPAIRARSAKPNWLLYQRLITPACRPSSPSCCGSITRSSTALARSKPGEHRGKASVADARQLFAAVATQQAEIEAAGFRLVREWYFDPKQFDFALLQQELEVATDAAVAQLRAKHPGLNAFALATDEGAMTILPIANVFDSIEEAEDDELWWPDEWSLSEGDEHFDIAYRLISSRHRDELSKVPFSTFKAGVRKAMLAALARLDAQGVLGDRDQRVLLYHEGDGVPAPAMVKKLLSPALFARWREWSGG